MKKIFQSVMFLLFAGWMSMSVNAQVNVGSLDNPHGGSLLDLSKGTNRGLLLPRVWLNNVSAWQLEGSKDDGSGMMVYNTNNDVTGGSGSGVYVWNGTAWSPVKSTVTADVKVVGFDVTPSDNEVSIFTNSSKSFTVSNFLPSTASYQGVSWTLSSPDNHVQITASTMTQCTVKGLSAGDAVLNIVSLDGNFPKTVTIHVVDITVKSFTLPSTLSIRANEEGTLTASSFTGSDDNAMSDVTVTWSTEDGTTTAGSITPTTGSNTTTITAGSSAGNFKVKATAGSITKECLVTVTVLNPDDYPEPNGTTYKPLMSGVTCIDVRSGQGNPGTQQYVVTETGSGSKTIKEVIWTVTPSVSGLLTSNTVSGTGNVTQNLVFKTQAELLALAASTDQTVALAAYIEYSDGVKAQLRTTVKIQNRACCPGYLITKGAFEGGPSAVTTSLNVSQVLALYNTSSKDLCVGPNFGANRTWNSVTGDFCNTNVHNQGGNWNDGNNDWRLPNIGELVNMHQYKASIPDLVTSSYSYWSSTDLSGVSNHAVVWDFYGSGHTSDGGKAASYTVVSTRCVRTIN